MCVYMQLEFGAVTNAAIAHASTELIHVKGGTCGSYLIVYQSLRGAQAWHIRRADGALPLRIQSCLCLVLIRGS